jgi:phospholipase/carboxylesterase
LLSNEHRFDVYKAEGDHLYLEPKGEHTSTLLWLHGLGDTSQGFLDIFMDGDQFKTVNETTKVVLLQAPTRAVTLNNGMKMPSWYDILSMNIL